MSQVEKIDDILLRHLISDQDRWWPARSNLDRNMAEIEAEAVAYIVTKRRGSSGQVRLMSAGI